jgi:glycosyltransferase involved in cell wall biosynthesis
LRTVQPEILFSAETPVNSLAIMARQFAGHPKHLIVSEHNHVSSVAKNAVRLGDRLRPLLVRYLYPQADLIVSVSNGIAEDLAGSYRMDRNKIRTIHNMFDVKKIAADSRIKPDHPWFKENNLPIIVNMGRLVPQKDQATLIKAFALLRAHRPCRLMILGDGPERSKLMHLARELNVMDDIFMPGFVTNPFSFMATAKVFVLSSAWEGLPGALIEALACGLPVVSTDCPSGPAEILQNGKFGVLTPVGNEQALAEAILQTLDHPHPSGMLLQRAMDFSVENIIPQYRDIFQSAAS